MSHRDHRPTGEPEASEHLDDDQLGGLSMLPQGDPERLAAEAHAKDCPQCGPAWRAAATGLSSLDVLKVEPPPPRLSAVKERVTAKLDADGRAVAREGLVLAFAGVVVALAFYAFPLACTGVLPYLEAAFAGLCALWVAAAATNRHRARLALGGAAIGSAVLLALDVDDGGAAVDHGVMCAAIVGVSAVVPAVVAAWLSVTTIEGSPGWRTAARTAAAALLAQGALVLLCDNHGLTHLLPFHVGAVALSTAVGAVLPRATRRLRGA